MIDLMLTRSVTEVVPKSEVGPRRMRAESTHSVDNRPFARTSAARNIVSHEALQLQGLMRIYASWLLLLVSCTSAVWGTRRGWLNDCNGPWKERMIQSVPVYCLYCPHFQGPLPTSCVLSLTWFWLRNSHKVKIVIISFCHFIPADFWKIKIVFLVFLICLLNVWVYNISSQYLEVGQMFETPCACSHRYHLLYWWLHAQQG